MANQLSKIFIKGIKLLVCIVILDLGIGFLLETVLYNQKTGKFSRIIHSLERTNAELLVLGSSHAVRHYVPEVMEKELKWSCYNAGVRGQRLVFHTALQEIILSRYTPKTIILNIDHNWLYYNAESYERLNELNPFYSKYPEQIKEVVSLKSEIEPFKLYSKLYQYNSTVLHVLNYAIREQKDFKGYMPLKGSKVTEKDLSSDNAVGNSRDKVIDEQFVNALKTFIKRCKEKSIQLLFVVSPSIKPAAANDQSFSTINTIAKEHQIPVWNFESHPEFFQKPELFYDTSHLNHTGAKIFSALIARELAETKQFMLVSDNSTR
mgnify:CR=1 FL=1